VKTGLRLEGEDSRLMLRFSLFWGQLIPFSKNHAFGFFLFHGSPSLSVQAIPVLILVFEAAID